MQTPIDRQHKATILKKYVFKADDMSWRVRMAALQHVGEERQESKADASVPLRAWIDPLWMLGMEYSTWLGLETYSLDGAVQGGGSDGSEENLRARHLWPPVGLVAESLVAACASPNHAWFLASTNLILMVLNQHKRWTPIPVSAHQAEAPSDTTVVANSQHNREREHGVTIRRCAQEDDLTDARRELLNWYLAKGLEDGSKGFDGHGGSLSSSVRFEGSIEDMDGAPSAERHSDTASDTGRQLDLSMSSAVQSLGEWFDLALLSSVSTRSRAAKF